MDEGQTHFAFTHAKTSGEIGKQSNATAFQVFDQNTLNLLEPRYKTGTPVIDNTLDGLANKMGVDARQFCDTVEEFNKSTPAGHFKPFVLDGLITGGKLSIPKTNWALPLDKPPYVAYRVTGGITFTYAGLKTDTSAHVLNKEGKRMPGLWAVDEISGGFLAFNYPGGAGLAKGARYGRIAGALAAERAQELKDRSQARAVL